MSQMEVRRRGPEQSFRLRLALLRDITCLPVRTPARWS
jgi:hypothetical protein